MFTTIEVPLIIPSQSILHIQFTSLPHICEEDSCLLSPSSPAFQQGCVLNSRAYAVCLTLQGSVEIPPRLKWLSFHQKPGASPCLALIT